jgi:hypothetical protein
MFRGAWHDICANLVRICRCTSLKCITIMSSALRYDYRCFQVSFRRLLRILENGMLNMQAEEKRIFEIKHGNKRRIEKNRFNVLWQMLENCKTLKNYRLFLGYSNPVTLAILIIVINASIDPLFTDLQLDIDQLGEKTKKI